MQVQRPLAEALRAGVRMEAHRERRGVGRDQIIQRLEIFGLYHQNSGFWNCSQ